MLGYLLLGSISLTWWTVSTVSSLAMTGVTRGVEYLIGYNNPRITTEDLENELKDIKLMLHQERLERVVKDIPRGADLI